MTWTRETGLPAWGGTPVKSSIILVGDAHAQADRGSPPARLPYEQMTSRSGRKLRRAPRQLGWGGSSLTRTRPVIGIRRTTQPQVPRLPRTQTRHPMKNISSVTAVGPQLIAAIGTADQTRWVPVAAFQRTALVHEDPNFVVMAQCYHHPAACSGLGARKYTRR